MRVLLLHVPRISVDLIVIRLTCTRDLLMSSRAAAMRLRYIFVRITNLTRFPLIVDLKPVGTQDVHVRARRLHARKLIAPRKIAFYSNARWVDQD